MTAQQILPSHCGLPLRYELNSYSVTQTSPCSIAQMIKLYFWVCWTMRRRLASPCMQSGGFVLPPPLGTIKTLDLQRAHFSTAKTTPPLVIMSLETRSDHLSSWCNSEPCRDSVGQKLHGSTKNLKKGFWEIRLFKDRRLTPLSYLYEATASSWLT